MERPPLYKKEEEVNINSGGDAKVQIPPTVVEPRWAASMGPWYNRLPEVFTMSWVVVILIGALLLVLYSFNLTVDRGERFVPLNCNMTTPPSYNVFLHEIVAKNMPLPLGLYSDYISDMALRYPNLKFHLIFLYDNDLSMIPTRILTRFYPMAFQEEDRKRIQQFQDKFNNVNVTVTTLCKFLLSSPLKYKLRYMLPNHVPVYLRALSVWMHGGIGIDMTIPQKNVHAILNQHNLGFREPDYADTIKTLSIESDNFMDILLDVVKKYVNTPQEIFTRNFSAPKTTQQMFYVDWPITRSQRNKRNAEDYSVVNASLTTDPTSSKPIETEDYDTTTLVPNEILAQEPSQLPVTNKTKRVPSVKIEEEVGDNMGNNVVFLDIALYAERPVISPIALIDKGGALQKVESMETRRQTCFGTVPYLTVLSDGAIVAATSRQHPLLTKLMLSTVFPANPVDLLRDFYNRQCSGSNAELDPYCKKIFIA